MCTVRIRKLARTSGMLQVQMNDNLFELPTNFDRFEIKFFKYSMFWLICSLNNKLLYKRWALMWLEREKNFVFSKMDILIPVQIFLLLFHCPRGYSYSTSTEQAIMLANSIKILVEAVAKPSYLTVMACWDAGNNQNYHWQNKQNIHWIVADFSFHFYRTYNDNGDNGPHRQIIITHSHFVDVPVLAQEYNEFIVIDLGCAIDAEILLNVTDNFMNYFWIILDLQSTEVFQMIIIFLFLYSDCYLLLQDSKQRFGTTINNLSLSPKSEIFYIMKQDSSFEIQQIYRVDMSMPLIFEQFGTIVGGQLMDDRMSPISSQRRTDLLGLTLKASMVFTNNDTINHLTDYR